nr:hypothetical protein [uncultured Dyadobacter sp.]
MKLKILFNIAVLLVLCDMAKAQSAPPMIAADKTIDTTAAYSLYKANAVKIGLKDLMRSSDQLRFRFWCRNQLVEIWTGNQNTFLGELVSYTSEYDPNPSSTPVKKEKFFTKRIAIDTIIARRIYERAMDVALFDIPGQANIKGWQLGFDGYVVSLEYSNPLRYSMKDYWSPHNQLSVPEAKLIDNFEAFLEANLGLRKKWDTFIHELPKGCYRTEGIALICSGGKEAR